ncbi:hypothetical protein HDU96_007411, partial [Phlyctochytrium bullatum]
MEDYCAIKKIGIRVFVNKRRPKSVIEPHEKPDGFHLACGACNKREHPVTNFTVKDLHTTGIEL